MTLRDRVISLVKQHNMSQKDFANAISAPLTTVNGRFKQENRSPSSEYIIPICRLFSVSCNWLLTGEEENESKPAQTLQPEEDEILNVYRKLDVSGKRQLMGKAYELLDKKENAFAESESEEAEIHSDILTHSSVGCDGLE